MVLTLHKEESSRLAEVRRVYCARLKPKEIHRLTRKVMLKIGLDLADQRSKSVGEYMGRINFTWLITVCADAEEKCPRTFPRISHHTHWPVDDPATVERTAEVQLAAFRRARDDLDRRIRSWLADQAAALDPSSWPLAGSDCLHGQLSQFKT